MADALAGIARAPASWPPQAIAMNIRELASGEVTIALPREPEPGPARSSYPTLEETEARLAAERAQAAAAVRPPTDLSKVLRERASCHNGNGAQRRDKES